MIDGEGADLADVCLQQVGMILYQHWGYAARGRVHAVSAHTTPHSTAQHSTAHPRQHTFDTLEAEVYAVV